MRRLLTCLGVAALTTLVSARPSEAQCRAADSVSARLVKQWRNLMVNTDGSVRLSLSRIGVAQVDSSTVVLVTDKTSCAKAVKSYNGSLGPTSPPPSGSVYLIKVGSMYIAVDPTQTGGGWNHVVVLDNRFFRAASFMG